MFCTFLLCWRFSIWSRACCGTGTQGAKVTKAEIKQGRPRRCGKRLGTGRSLLAPLGNERHIYGHMKTTVELPDLLFETDENRGCAKAYVDQEPGNPRIGDGFTRRGCILSDGGGFGTPSKRLPSGRPTTEAGRS